MQDKCTLQPSNHMKMQYKRKTNFITYKILYNSTGILSAINATWFQKLHILTSNIGKLPVINYNPHHNFYSIEQ